MKENRQHRDTNKVDYKQQGGRITEMKHKMVVVQHRIASWGGRNRQ